ncbi:MAG: phosphoribosylformylglycinamidine synthase I [Candidatus Micrarchaeia archaeon]
MRVAVIRFPGSNCDLDAVHALRDVLHAPCELVWHKEFKAEKFDAAILPGGFSYGDHLRAGVIAAFSPAMKEVRRMAEEGKPVLGICNGFQILVEGGLLPGALLRNAGMSFVCRWVTLRVERNRSLFASHLQGRLLRMPVAHGEGRYYVEEDELSRLYANGQVVFKYVNEKGEATPEANPNGSLDNIAGVCNERGNVLGLMPHPERASEAILGGIDGRELLGILAR